MRSPSQLVRTPGGAARFYPGRQAGAREGASGTTSAELGAVLMANLCEVTPEFIAALYMCDYLAIRRVYEGFLPSG